jgi:hypothetical protein
MQNAILQPYDATVYQKWALASEWKEGANVWRRTPVRRISRIIRG